MNETRDTKELCPACGYPVDECVCCPECGHVCPIDEGETYCPVCGPPEPEKKDKE